MDYLKTNIASKRRVLKDIIMEGAGLYFITICVKNRECCFGNVIDGEMKLSNIGGMAKNFWLEISKHFPFVELDEFVVMPNHLHGVLLFNEWDKNIGGCAFEHVRRDAINRVSTAGGATHQYNPMGKGTLGEIMRWYKGRCSFEINHAQNEIHFEWQPRFYDHIIRDENDLNRIRKYIGENPIKWEFDRNNKENLYM